MEKNNKKMRVKREKARRKRGEKEEERDKRERESHRGHAHLRRRSESIRPLCIQTVRKRRQRPGTVLEAAGQCGSSAVVGHRTSHMRTESPKTCGSCFLLLRLPSVKRGKNVMCRNRSSNRKKDGEESGKIYTYKS